MYHPNKLNEFCDKFTSGWCEYTYKSGKKKELIVKLPDMVKMRAATPWKKAILTDLGKELLGLIKE